MQRRDFMGYMNSGAGVSTPSIGVETLVSLNRKSHNNGTEVPAPIWNKSKIEVFTLINIVKYKK